MKACIYGAGAIGGWLGMALAQAGHTVSMVARGDTLRALQADGLRLRRPDGTLAQVAVTAHNDPAALGVQDLVVVAVKAPGLPDVARATSGRPGAFTAMTTRSCTPMAAGSLWAVTGTCASVPSVRRMRKPSACRARSVSPRATMLRVWPACARATPSQPPMAPAP